MIAPAPHRSGHHRVVITGLGAVTPYGVGVDAYWRGLLEGRSTIHRIRCFDPSPLASQVAAEVQDWDPETVLPPKEVRRLPRVAVMAIDAARQTACSAALPVGELSLETAREIGCVLGSGGGGIAFAEEQYRLHFTGEKDGRCHPFAVSTAFVGMLSSEVSIDLGLHGACHVVSTGCTSATDAMGYAMQLVRSGRLRAVLTGGADCAITPGIVACYCRMRCISTHWNDTPTRASCPFNRDRDGFVIG